MKKNGGGTVFAYASEAKKEWAGKVDVVTSFDVIEHVESPFEFLKDAYDLLTPGGQAIIETPTDTPVSRKLLGEVYEKIILFTAQHLWILSEESLRIMANKIGFAECSFRYFQKWDMMNLLAWLKYQKPLSIGSKYGEEEIHLEHEFLTDTLNSAYKTTLEEKGLADTIVMYLKK